MVALKNFLLLHQSLNDRVTLTIIHRAAIPTIELGMGNEKIINRPNSNMLSGPVQAIAGVSRPKQIPMANNSTGRILVRNEFFIVKGPGRV